MSVLEFTASIIRSLAWPLVVLAGLLLFRRAIEGRILSILKISHKDTEVVFDHTAREVEAAIAVVELPETARREFDARVHIAPNTSKVIKTWTELEEVVRQRLSRAGIDISSLGSAAILQVAQEHNLLTGDQMRALVGLNAMRNLAVHGRDDDIDERRVQEFIVLAEAMKAVLAIT